MYTVHVMHMYSRWHRRSFVRNGEATIYVRILSFVVSLVGWLNSFVIFGFRHLPKMPKMCPSTMTSFC